MPGPDCVSGAAAAAARAASARRASAVLMAVYETQSAASRRAQTASISARAYVRGRLARPWRARCPGRPTRAKRTCASAAVCGPICAAPARTRAVYRDGLKSRSDSAMTKAPFRSAF